MPFYVPPDNIRQELIAYLEALFPDYFKETNIHPAPLSVEFSNDNGVITSSATLRWQRSSDYKIGEHRALFTYKERRASDGRETYWYCTYGLPGD